MSDLSLAQDTLKALWKVTKIVLDTLDFNQVTQKTCDSLLNELGYLNLGYRIIVFSLYKEDINGLQRISLSQTPQAQAATSISTIPFHDIVIPVTATDNLCIKAFLEQKPQHTTDWKDILSPPLSPEDARTNQNAAGIKTSMIFPVVSKGKSLGTLIFSLVKDYSQVSASEFDLINGFTDIVGVAVQNSVLYSSLENTTNKLNEANQKLQEIDNLKDEFVSLASHELRTPMTAIKSYVWMVQNDKAGPITQTTKKYLDIVYSSTDRLIHLVNDMLDISRIESGRFQLHPVDFDFSELIHEIQTEFSAKASERNLNWQTRIDPSQITVKADRDKIMQVLENLIGNAFKFTPDGGSISLFATTKDRQLVVSVTDTGRGIAGEDIPKLFTKFTRLGEGLPTLAKPGTGLGLYLAKQFVELHHGQISVESVLGQGSTFTFTIPMD